MSSDSATPVPTATPALPAVGAVQIPETTTEQEAGQEAVQTTDQTPVATAVTATATNLQTANGPAAISAESGSSAALRPTIDPPAPVRYLDSPLLRRGFWTGSVWCAGILAGGGLLGLLAGSWTGLAAAMTAIMVTSWPFYTPVRITVGPHGVLTQAMWRKYLLRWTRVAKIEFRESGFVLVEQPRDVNQHPARTEIPWNNLRSQIEPVLRFYLAACIAENQPLEAATPTDN